MSGLDLLVDGFPHGTIEGHTAGCRGEICPAKREHGWSCAGAVIRFRGDFVFRRRVEAGMGPSEIAAADAEDARVAREAERAAVVAERLAARAAAAVSKPKVRRVRERKTSRRPRVFTEWELQRIRELHALRWTDGRIGAEIGRPASSVQDHRSGMGLAPVVKEPPPIIHGKTGGYNRGCRTVEGCPESPSCLEVARAHWQEANRLRRQRLAADRTASAERIAS